MFRPGSHNPRTVYWSAPSGPDRFAAVAMSDEAAVGMAGLLNAAVGDAVPDFIATLPMVPKLAKSTAVQASRVTVHFSGGPWDGKTTDIERVVAPVFGPGHEVGNHYWLDTTGTGPPTYHWDGTAWEVSP